MKVRKVEKKGCKCLFCDTEFENSDYTWEIDGVDNND